MAVYYTVSQGECMSSIAKDFGFYWKTIWEHPENAGLKGRRVDPNILYPGDVVYIPDKRPIEVSRATEKRHLFRLKAWPAKLNVRLLQNDRPRANISYILIIDGRSFQGTTDEDGWVRQAIPPDAKQGKLILAGEEEYLLDLGHLDPVDEMSGIQGRLQNLGLYGGPIDGQMNPDLEAALKNFQQKKGVAVTGRPDQQTKDALKSTFGS